MSIMALTPLEDRRRAAQRPEALTAIVAAALVMLVFVGIALVFETAALLIPGGLFFAVITAAALKEARPRAEVPDYR